MSLPKIPDMNPEINIKREDAINMLITSVAMEELALSHIINAEGEKIQYILGTLENTTPPEVVTVCDVLKINESVIKTLKNAIRLEMMLEAKLEDVLSADSTDEEE